jgi:rod shape-determining protein MreC
MKFTKMGGPKKRLLYYIGCLVLVLFVLRGPINSTEGIFGSIFFPLKSKIYGYRNEFKVGISTLKNYKEILEENKILKYEVAKLGILEKNTENLLAENARLRKLMDMKQNSKRTFKVAKVSFKDSLTYHESIFIDLGENDGIKKNMVVLNGESVLGRISEVYGSYSVVELITKNDIYTSVLSDKNEVLGVLKGENSEEMTMESVSVDKNIELDEIIYTSGISDIYPKGMYVGRVSSIGESKNQLFKDIKIKQEFKIFDINEVIILEEE